MFKESKKEMKYLLIMFLIFLILGCEHSSITSENTDTSSNKTWQLVWADEFEGNVIDSSIWTRDTGEVYNEEWQNYTDSEENSKLVNGNLVITAKSNGTLGKRDGSITSARLISRNKYEVTYGKIVARIKVPTGQGIWPAFWMLGSNMSTVSWPACGEIDIMEKIGGNDRVEKTLFGTAHLTGSSIGGDITISDYLSNDYHEYSIEWDKDLIVWKLDGEKYFSLEMTDSKFDAFEKPFYLLLNVAVGGTWPGAPDSTTEFPQEMLVDWVRVYQWGVVEDC